MALTAVGLAVGVGSAAEAGYSSKRGHDQAVQGKHAADDAAAKQKALEDDLAARKKADQDRSDQTLLYQRQRALALSSNYRSGNIRTSGSGIPPATGGAPQVGGNSYLGAA